MIEMPKLSKPPAGDGGPRWFQIAVALSMVLSAVAALVSSIRTSAAMSSLVEQNARLVRAGSTPILQWDISNANAQGEPQLSFSIENAGTGPARVVWMELRYKQQPLKSARDLLQRQNKELGLELKSAGNTMTGSIAGEVVVAGRSRTLFRWLRPKDDNPGGQRLWEAVDAAREHLAPEACYCSVFDECWTSRFDGELPRAVPACEAKGRVNLNS
ncbi:MAG: hypothetical protein IV092_19740 [Burkholderiaceae bacterium]|nr:hypothetical protein [Burkholderiaceae bacterium]MBT9503484.1 hypothetical protein [Burkholderiaceae bacterium]